MFGRSAFFNVLAVFLVGILEVLFDCSLVSMCSLASLQKLEVVAESTTADSFLLCLFSVFLHHVAAILLIGFSYSLP